MRGHVLSVLATSRRTNQLEHTMKTKTNSKGGQNVVKIKWTI